LEGVEVPTYDYTLPMMIFTAFGLLAIVFGFLLKAENKRKGYGLEMPNIEEKKVTTDN
jgi:phosphotransferase system  glucose/maltose/N-acetylglucosamine-specific IIC component